MLHCYKDRNDADYYEDRNDSGGGPGKLILMPIKGHSLIQNGTSTSTGSSTGSES